MFGFFLSFGLLFVFGSLNVIVAIVVSPLVITTRPFEKGPVALSL